MKSRIIPKPNLRTSRMKSDMIRKLSFLTAILLTVSAVCRKNNAAYQED